MSDADRRKLYDAALAATETNCNGAIYEVAQILKQQFEARGLERH